MVAGVPTLCQAHALTTAKPINIRIGGSGVSCDFGLSIVVVEKFAFPPPFVPALFPVIVQKSMTAVPPKTAIPPP
jgi:hypothetical protein